MPAAPHTRQPAWVREHLVGLLAPTVRSLGYDIEDVTVTPAGRRRLVRVVVDADHGVDLDAVAEVSHAVSQALDSPAGDELLAGPFVLEVTSPGVDRPLTEPRHWRRATGRLVSTSVDGSAVTGRVVGCDETGVRIAVAGAERAVPWTELGAGRVQVEFSRLADTEPEH
jgi:ribosome maturation factor RimP